MDYCLWTKTLLTVYRYLERIAGAIDRIVLSSGLSSFNVSAQTYHFNNVFSISKKIIDLSERKVTLINLKVLVEDVLKELNSNDSTLLIEKYIDGQKSKQLVESLGISTRSLFRKLDYARKNFARKLELRGYTCQKLQDMLKNEEWILNVYRRFENKEDDEGFVISNSYLSKAVS